MDETDAQQQPYWTDLEEIARPARERRRLPPEVRSQIIIKLCRRAPLSVKDLSILLDRSEAYVGDAIRPLVTSGLLTFLYPDQPRHPRQKYIGAPEGAAPPPVTLPEELEVLIEPAGSDDTMLRPQTLPRSDTPMPVDGMPPRFPNQLTNLLFVVGVGIALGLTGLAWWWVPAVVAAVALAGLHIAVDSGQYLQFSALRFIRNKPTGFLLLKAAVAFVEIAIVYAIVRVFFGSE